MGLRENKAKKKIHKHTKEKEKALRIGIIQRGKLVEERWFRKATAITVGTAAKNTFHVEGTHLPPRYPLFVATKEGLALQVPEGTRGKLVTGGRHLPLLQAESIGKEVGGFTTRAYRAAPSQQHAVYSIDLKEEMRGRVELGETTLLFQFATPPPAPEVAAVPHLLRGNWHKGVDWAYASIIMLSFVAHSVGVYWLQQMGPLQNQTMGSFENLTSRIKPQMVIIPRVKKPTPAVKKADKPKQAKDDKPGKTNRPRQRTNRHRARTATPVPKKVNARDIGILKLLSSKGKNGNVKDLMANDGSDTMFKTLRKLKGVSTAMKGRYKSRRKDAKLPKNLQLRQALIGDSLNKQPNIYANGKPTTGRVAADLTKAAKDIKITFDPPDVTGTLDVKTMMSTIRRNYGSFKYCYERVLKRVSGLKGKVAIEAKINRMGRAIGVQVVSNTLGHKGVARCIVRRIKTLRFPRPKDGDVTVELPFVFAQGE